MDPGSHPPTKGRGAQSRPANRFERVRTEDDLQDLADDERAYRAARRPPTQLFEDQSKSIVSENHSPDIFFRYSVNPYRGCEHGCSYCYARPTHEYLGLSAGLDFETKILFKPRAAELFRAWLARPAYVPEQVVFSGVTDCYQPVERRLRLTRACLEVAAECRQPLGVVTKNALVTRDLDLFSSLAQHGAVSVAVSIPTLDESLSRRMEPRTSSPTARLRAIEQLAAAGVPTQVMAAPVIPGLTDSATPAVLAAARDAGATSASFTLLRLPHAVREVFFEWLAATAPTHAQRVDALVRSTRDGRLNDSGFGSRMRGGGAYAQQIGQTFRAFARKLGLAERPPTLSTAAFRPPVVDGQRRLF